MKQIVVVNSKGGCGKSTVSLALADVLEADLIDLDEQGTLTNVAKFTDRLGPLTDVSLSTKKLVIFDTPPYHDERVYALLESCDLIVMPTKVTVPDLLALVPLVKRLGKKGLLEKALMVFNEVRRPTNNTYREAAQLFLQNFPNVRKAEAELSNLVSYQRLFSEPLSGQARKEVEKLSRELVSIFAI